MTEFQKKVFDYVKTIPKGETKTHKEVAVAIGKSSSARAIGNALNSNTDKNIPCHRIVRSDGKIGGYNGLRGSKEEILRKERV